MGESRPPASWHIRHEINSDARTQTMRRSKQQSVALLKRPRGRFNQYIDETEMTVKKAKSGCLSLVVDEK